MHAFTLEQVLTACLALRLQRPLLLRPARS